MPKRQDTRPSNKKIRTLVTRRQSTNWAVNNYILVKKGLCTEQKEPNIDNLKYKCQRRSNIHFFGLGLGLASFFPLYHKKVIDHPRAFRAIFFLFRGGKRDRNRENSRENDRGNDKSNINRPEWAQILTQRSLLDTGGIKQVQYQLLMKRHKFFSLEWLQSIVVIPT